MTFDYVLRTIKNDQGARPAGWRGYAKRADVTSGIVQFSESSTYALGAEVQYGGKRYVCTVAVMTAGPFNYANWTEISFDFDLMFLDADDPVGTPSGKYRVTVGLTGVTYAATQAVSSLDAQLLAAFASDTWEISDVASLEAVRKPAQGTKW